MRTNTGGADRGSGIVPGVFTWSHANQASICEAHHKPASVDVAVSGAAELFGPGRTIFEGRDHLADSGLAYPEPDLIGVGIRFSVRDCINDKSCIRSLAWSWGPLKRIVDHTHEVRAGLLVWRPIWHRAPRAALRRARPARSCPRPPIPPCGRAPSPNTAKPRLDAGSGWRTGL
jgi:hypothetical protein